MSVWNQETEASILLHTQLQSPVPTLLSKGVPTRRACIPPTVPSEADFDVNVLQTRFLGGPDELGGGGGSIVSHWPRSGAQIPAHPRHFSRAWTQELDGWGPGGISLWGLGSSQNPDMGPLLLFLAGGKGRDPTIKPANKTEYHVPPLLPHPPGNQAPSTLLPSCFPQGHHPSSSEVSNRLLGHSHQLFSHPSKDPVVQACPPPFPGLQGPHSTWP